MINIDTVWAYVDVSLEKGSGGGSPFHHGVNVFVPCQTIIDVDSQVGLLCRFNLTGHSVVDGMGHCWLLAFLVGDINGTFIGIKLH